jgi:hypothetical protein
MRALSIILLCCLAWMILGMLQASTCKSQDPVNNPTPCTNAWGLAGCAVLLYTLFLLYKKK